MSETPQESDQPDVVAPLPGEVFILPQPGHGDVAPTRAKPREGTPATSGTPSSPTDPVTAQVNPVSAPTQPGAAEAGGVVSAAVDDDELADVIRDRAVEGGDVVSAPPTTVAATTSVPMVEAAGEGTRASADPTAAPLVRPGAVADDRRGSIGRVTAPPTPPGDEISPGQGDAKGVDGGGPATVAGPATTAGDAIGVHAGPAGGGAEKVKPGAARPQTQASGKKAARGGKRPSTTPGAKGEAKGKQQSAADPVGAVPAPGAGGATTGVTTDVKGSPPADDGATPATPATTATTATPATPATTATEGSAAAGEVPLGSGPGEDGKATMPRVMAIANQKGGVGKTTTAVNLGAALADLGFRVLVVDLDPQGNATTGLGLDGRNFEVSMYDVIMRDVPMEDVVEPTSVRNLFVAPATIDLAGAEIELVPAFSREMKLRRAIDSVADEFSYVLIDCPPSLGLITVNGLAAAREVLVPIQCEYYALEGLSQLLRNVNLVASNLNPELKVSTIVLTMYDARTKLAEQVANEVREHFGAAVCTSVIPRTVRLSEAPSFGQPITVFDPSSRGAIAYRELAKEVSGGSSQRSG